MTFTKLISHYALVFALLAAALPLSVNAAEQRATVQNAQIAPININTATAEMVAQTLNGVGLKRAQAIVNYREKHGSFTTFDDLQQVKGIGDAVIERNRNLIIFE